MKELYDRLEMVSGAMDEISQEDNRVKQPLARLWEKNVSFANGDQSADFGDNTYATDNGSILNISQFFTDNREQAYKTNEIRPILRTLVSYCTRVKPTVSASAPGSGDTSKRRAKIAENIITAKHEIDNEVSIARTCANNAFVYGTAIRKDYWDSTKGYATQMPVFDELGNPVINPETGEVVLQEQKTGDSNVAALTPLSISCDWSFTEFSELPYLIESYLMPVDWAKRAYNFNGQGLTGNAEKIVAMESASFSLSTLERLKYATPTSKTSSTYSFNNKTIIEELYVEPNDSLPRGRMVIRAGGIVVYDSYNNGQDLGCPYYNPYQPVMWHPYSFLTYEKYIGRLWGKSMVEDLLPLQVRLNEINGAILHNANTCAKVDWLAIEGQLKKGAINGEGGNIFTFRPHPSGFVPQKIPGVPLPSQFFQERESIIEQMVRIAGTNFAMSGQAPKGVTAAAAIEQLLDNASSQQSDFINAWERFNEDGFTKKLRVIRSFNIHPNYTISDYILKMDRDALDEDIEAFVGEDIGDGITLKIEAGSTVPKSERAKREIYKEFAAQGLLGPVAEDTPRGAKLRKELLSKFGEDGFETEEIKDIEKANWENERIIKGEPVEVWELDNHELHLQSHVTKAKDPKFLERASDEVKMKQFEHIQTHRDFIAQAQQQQMMMQQQMQPEQKQVDQAL